MPGKACSYTLAVNASDAWPNRPLTIQVKAGLSAAVGLAVTHVVAGGYGEARTAPDNRLNRCRMTSGWTGRLV
jgi:hypothetical protein